MSKIVPLEGFGGGSSSPLNFKIVAYATEEELAAAQPAENTIGVVTTNTITSWIFDAIEPTDPIEGMVWITTGTSSTVAFNALKKNNITVYPGSTMQYVGGSWVDVNAHCYQGGKWVQFSEIIKELYLYNLGDMCEEVTGGWTKFGSASMKNTTACLEIVVPASYKSGGAQTVNLIDMTDYNVIECESTSNTDDFLLCVNKDGTDVATGTSNIPISGITGMCRIRFYSKDSGSTADKLTVTSLRLKK